MKNRHLTYKGATAVALVMILGLPAANAAEVYLKAGEFVKTIPYGEGQGAPEGVAAAEVTMWGFCETATAAAADLDCKDGTELSSPGPVLTVPTGDSSLTITLKNTLTDATSLMIVGQANPPLPNPVPDSYRAPNGGLNTFVSTTAAFVDGSPAPTGTYTWTGIRPGSYLYQSGTHVQKQVQMGLYGALIQDADSGDCVDASPCAYPDASYDKQQVLVFSEIDPKLHDPDPMPANATVDGYNPQFFLINGEPFDPAARPSVAGVAGDAILLRLINAGLDNRSLQLLGGHFEELSEDGRRLPTTKQKFSTLLPAAKSKDLMFRPTEDGDYPLFDRRGKLVNGPAHGGGLFTQIRVGCPDCINFTDNNESYSAGQDIDQNAVVFDNGLGITISENTWRRTLTSYTITSNTRLAFTYESTAPGEINGIGFDADTAVSSDQTFKLAGSQVWGINDFVYNGSGPQDFDIPVGNYFNGSGLNLVLVSDQDAGAGSNATFTNVRVYEMTPPPPPASCPDCVVFTSNNASYSAAQDVDQNAVVSADGTGITLSGNTWRRTLSSYDITLTTILEFTYESTAPGEITGIGFDADTAVSPTQTFQLAGSQNWGLRDFSYSGSGTQSFVIPVGDLFHRHRFGPGARK